MGQDEAELGPRVFQMNHTNDKYKIASKHVRLHCHTAAPKAKAKGKAKSAPKAVAKARA